MSPPPPSAPPPHPVRIELKKSRTLHIAFSDDTAGEISADALRDASPAADGKPETPSCGVLITALEQVGNYAVKPVFSDGHDTGIYGWGLLYYLANAPAAEGAPAAAEGEPRL